MDIEFNCPHCDSELTVSQDHLGEIDCPACENIVEFVAPDYDKRQSISPTRRLRPGLFIGIGISVIVLVIAVAIGIRTGRTTGNSDSAMAVVNPVLDGYESVRNTHGYYEQLVVRGDDKSAWVTVKVVTIVNADGAFVSVKELDNRLCFAWIEVDGLQDDDEVRLLVTDVGVTKISDDLELPNIFGLRPLTLNKYTWFLSQGYWSDDSDKHILDMKEMRAIVLLLKVQKEINAKEILRQLDMQ